MQENETTIGGPRFAARLAAAVFGITLALSLAAGAVNGPGPHTHLGNPICAAHSGMCR